MKSALQYLVSTLAILLLLQSCSVEKRRYTGGYHIERWGHRPAVVAHPHDNECMAPTAQQELARTPLQNSDTVATALTAPPAKHVEPNKVDVANNTTRHNATKRQRIERALKSHPRISAWEGRRQDSIGEGNPGGAATSRLAIVTIIVGAAALLIILAGFFLMEGWAAIGYIILGVLGAMGCFLFGLLTIIFDREAGMHIPALFWPFFILSGIITIWVLVASIGSKLGLF